MKLKGMDLDPGFNLEPTFSSTDFLLLKLQPISEKTMFQKCTHFTKLDITNIIFIEGKKNLGLKTNKCQSKGWNEFSESTIPLYILVMSMTITKG